MFWIGWWCSTMTIFWLFDCLNVHFRVCSGYAFCVTLCLCLSFFVYVFDGHGGEQWVKIWPVDIVYVAPFRVIVILRVKLVIAHFLFMFQCFGTVLFEMQINPNGVNPVPVIMRRGRPRREGREKFRICSDQVVAGCVMSDGSLCSLGEGVLCAENCDFPCDHRRSLSTWNDIDV